MTKLAARVLAFFVLLALLVAPRPAAAADASTGRSILETRCAGCHSLDGSPRVGPSLARTWGTDRKVTSDGMERSVTFDEAYLGRSLRDPDADVAVGFPKGNMPKFAFDDDRVASIGQAIAELNESRDRGPKRTQGGLVALAIACLGFVGLHVLLSSIPVRTRLVARLGGKKFAALYAVVIGITFVAIVVAFRYAAFVEVWAPPRWGRFLPILVVPIAVWFIGAGNATRGPTAAGGKMPEDARPSGILAITRHPALCGFSLWAIAHFFANGELRAVLVFATILALAIIGMFHIDHRREVEHGDAWRTYASRTSRFPFLAILGGRAKLTLKELRPRSVIVAIILSIVFIGAHPYLIGVSPIP